LEINRKGGINMNYYTWLDTPAGKLLLTGDGKTITGMYWKVFKRTPQVAPDWVEDKEVFAEVIRQLAEYFAGQRQQFDLVYKAVGTPFQARVWQELAELPFGHTCTYLELAERIGRPKAVRAVAGAVGNNPISIVVPCHRVLGAKTRLTGYAGGLESKATLLRLEGIAYKK
jgi:methylated-DNA-[protein]-cysteine S-methyltransferase